MNVPARTPSPGPGLKACRASVRVRFGYDYLLSPPSGRTSGRPPLLVFLHGRDECGRDLSLLTRHGVPRLVVAGRRFPFTLVAPQCPAGEWWNPVALDAFIGEIMRRHPCDRSGVWLTGLSMGGFATWAVAQLRPDRYAAIIPICGGGETRLADRLRNLSIWAFHGARDPVVPVRRTMEMVRAVVAAGGRPRLTIYPGLAHDSWTRTYANPAVWTWLSRQRRLKCPALT